MAKGKFCVQEETEDSCFECKDGGKLVICDYENCGKVYHPKCVDKKGSFFDNAEPWVCGRHCCSHCGKPPEFYCLGCPSAVCRKCFADSEFTVLRGIKGLCLYCFELVEIIELNLDKDSDGNKINLDDKKAYEYFFKAYWEGVKVKEGFKSGGVSSAQTNCSKSESSLCSKGEEEKQNDLRSSDSNGDHTSKNTPTKQLSYKEEKQNDSRSLDSNEDHTCKNKDTKRKRYNLRKSESSLSSEGEEEKQNDSRSSDSNGDHTSKNKPVKWKRKNAMEFAGWGSKPLFSFLESIGKLETERMTPWDVKCLIYEYIKEKNLLHPKDSKKFLPDEKLFPIFRKKVMAKHQVCSTLENHIVEMDDSARNKKDDQSENSSKDNHLCDQAACIESRLSELIGKPLLKKGDFYMKPSCFALINARNIKLVYLKQSLVLELSKQPESFMGKVVGTFVRAKVDSKDHKQIKSYNLVRVLGVIHDEMHTGILLQVSFTPKTISISELSDEDFTEKECEDLKQKVEASMLQKLTVEELQEKAQSLHEDITKHWIATRLVSLQNQIDRANLRGREREKNKLLDEREKLKQPWKQEQLLKSVPSISPELIDAKYNDSDED